MAILKKNLITKNKWNIFFRTKLKQNLSVVGILFSHISGKPRRFLNADHNNYIESLYTSFSFFDLARMMMVIIMLILLELYFVFFGSL